MKPQRLTASVKIARARNDRNLRWAPLSWPPRRRRRRQHRYEFPKARDVNEKILHRNFRGNFIGTVHLVVGAAVRVGPRQGARRAGRERGRAVPLFPQS